MKYLIIIQSLILTGCCTPVVIKQEFPLPPSDLMVEPKQLQPLR